ncbi:MAG TPA: ACT domain-containing protein [Vitreimonas sp.]|uniref:ACT domain-containing protein n=1 Tax=Vitreimonas sp. TaxID=3069702 RepID=UPI002D4D4950|nr:ACT domain-containing protein [Vitreimonas sp.]HYD88095.1 ACT domain-containing protein [Vitreimonas sp.]
MTNTILVHIDRAEGSLQRLIGLIERRGFHIDRMAISDAGAAREVRVSLRARDAGRCIEVLGRQIDRQIGARRIAPASSPVEEAATCTV